MVTRYMIIIYEEFINQSVTPYLQTSWNKSYFLSWFFANRGRFCHSSLLTRVPVRHFSMLEGIDGYFFILASMFSWVIFSFILTRTVVARAAFPGPPNIRLSSSRTSSPASSDSDSEDYWPRVWATAWAMIAWRSAVVGAAAAAASWTGGGGGEHPDPLVPSPQFCPPSPQPSWHGQDYLSGLWLEVQTRPLM